MQHHPSSKDDKMLPYMDGVPVKISERYKPPRKVVLPVSCQHCSPSNALFEEYDFKLEHSVIKKMAEWKKARRDETERRKQRLRSFEEECNEGTDKLKELSLTEEAVETSSKSPPGADSPLDLLNPLPSDILKPMSAKEVVPIVKPNPNPYFINISDFESDNSSPFDNMELKTINDMEILASVLGSNDTKPIANNNVLEKEMNSNGYWNMSNGYHYPYANQHYPSVKHSIFSNRCDVYPVSVNYQSYAFSNQSGSGSCPNQTISHFPQVMGHNYHAAQNYGGCPLPDTNVTETRQKSSRSVPDIVQELEKELREKRRIEEMERKTRTPPPSCNEKPKVFAADSAKPLTTHKVKQLPNPIDNLPPKVQNLAHHISEMGFPLSRVARACQQFDADDKRIIEFLLQVQKFEERNYPGDLVEKTLMIKDLGEENILKFMDAALVLLDLGFEEERIHDALQRTHCDRDQALDMLIS